MSATLIPPTKTAGARPPILPPISTTFDGAPDDEGDSVDRLVEDGVRRLLRTVEHTPDERLPILYGLLAVRKQWLEREIATERLLESPELPPAMFNYLMLDTLLEPENDVVARYLRLIAELEDGMARVARKMREKNVPSVASDLA